MLIAESASTCRHCDRTIVLDTEEGWIDPAAGYDDVDGDGIWRTTCDENDTFEARHEPVAEQDRRCVHCGLILKPERDKGLLVDERTGDWWCRANMSNGGDAAPHEEA